MSDEVLTVKLTAREIDLIHQCISTNIETVKRRHDPTDPMISDLIAELGELSDDLLEQRFSPEDPDLFMDPVDFAAKHDTDLVICDAEINAGINREGEVFVVAEDDFIKRGMDAREQAKANSRAAERRNFNLKGPDPKLSKAQTHDVWDSNDPKNW